jgi:hypothetical protein
MMTTTTSTTIPKSWKRKRTKKTSGISRRLSLALLCTASSLAAEERYTLIAGTVFTENGFAIPNAELKLDPIPADGATPAKRFPRRTERTSFRGEFFFRVPNEPMQYRVTAKISRYQTQSKDIQVTEEDRIDLNFLLEPEKK